MVDTYVVEKGSTEAMDLILRKNRVLMTDKGAQRRYNPMKREFSQSQRKGTETPRVKLT
jgi:hypothetical protein